MVACEQIDGELSNRVLEEARTVSIPMAREALDWLEALYASGALIAGRGGVRFTPAVEEVLHALHQVLAGGKVRIELQVAGDGSRCNELDGKLEKALEASGSMIEHGLEAFAP